MEKGSNPFWTLSKAIRHKKFPIQPLNGPNGPVYTAAEKAETFAESLEKQFSPNEFNQNDHALKKRIESVNDKYIKITEEITTSPTASAIQPATTGEIECRIKCLSNRKAPGNDEIKHNALKHLPENGVEAPTTIINACLAFQHFPSAWKAADIILIPKPGKPHHIPENHRPISLLPTMGKLLERVIKSHLEEFVTEKKLIPDEQHGFHHRHSTNHQLLRVVEFITEGFNRRCFTTGLFLDIAKAFDKVWIECMIVKLSEAGLESPMLKIINSFMTNRSFRVNVNGEKSTTRTPTAGVPQGSALSPLLYNLYTHDIPIPAFIPGTNETIVAQYADDTAILARSLNRNRATGVDIQAWCANWRIQIHPEKSTAITFSRRPNRHDKNIKSIRMRNTNIPWARTVKYLGLTLDSRLNFSRHIAVKKKQASRVTGQLYPMIGHKSKLAINSKLLLYTAITRPIMTYACPIWAFASMKHIQTLQTIQNKSLRMISGAPWYVRNTTLHRDTKTDTILEHVMKLSKKFYSDMADHPNDTIKSLLNDYISYPHTDIARPRKVLLLKPP